MENIKPSETSELKELLNRYSPIFSEVRKRIFVTLFVFAASTVAGFVYYDKIIKIFIDILDLRGINIVFTSPFQFINLAISCGVATGLVITFPLLLYQILSFLRPALRAREFKMIVGLLPFSILLFLIGFSFGILVMKWQIILFLSQTKALGIGNILDINKLLSTVILVSSIMGVAFQFPIVILLLTSIGIIKLSHLKKYRLRVYFGCLIFTILLPPDSVLIAFLLALPLIILFELTLILSRIFERNKAAHVPHQV